MGCAPSERSNRVRNRAPGGQRFVKYAVITVLLFGIVAVAAKAEMNFGIGPSLLYIDQSFDSGNASGSPADVQSLMSGVNLDYYLGGTFGLISTNSIAVPLLLALPGSSTTQAPIMTYGIDSLLGAAFRFAFGPGLHVVLGVGGHLDVLIDTDFETRSPLASYAGWETVGAGIVVRSVAALGRTVSAYASVQGAYDFYDIVGITDQGVAGHFLRGFSVGVHAGISFSLF